MRKRLILLAFVLVLYIVPVNLTVYYAALTIPDEQNFTIAADEPWLDGWKYRKEIVLNQVIFDGSYNSGYPVKFNLEWVYGSDSGYTVYLSNHSQLDFDDIRFTDNDKVTKLDYWIRNYTLGVNMTVWVEVADVLVVGSGPSTVSIYVYYGNNAVSTTSNGDNTFLYFDDFEDADLIEWSSNNIEITSFTVLNGNYAAGVITDTAASDLRLDTDGLNETPFAYHISVNNDLTIRGAILRPFTTQNTSEYAGYVRTGYETATSRLYYYDGAFKAWSGSADDIKQGDWFDYEIRVDLEHGIGGDPLMKGYHEEGNTFTLNYDGEEDFHTPTDTDPLSLAMEWLDLVSQASYGSYYDDFFIRPTAYDSEPTVSSTSSEEAIPAEWVNLGDETVAVIFTNTDVKGMNTFILFLGLCLIPASTLFLVKGGKDDLSQNKVFYFIIMFLIGWGLVIGVIIS